MQQQPYRKGAREPSEALNAMLKGRSAQGTNSADITRATQRLMRLSSTSKPRPDRPARPDRPPRPKR
jgi:hypothetical protein